MPSFSSASSAHPRSRERGPVEATTAFRFERSLNFSIRAHVSAVPLKRKVVLHDSLWLLAIRAHVSAVPLKRFVCIHGSMGRNVHPRSRERGPVEATRQVCTSIPPKRHPRSRERGPVEAIGKRAKTSNAIPIRAHVSAVPLKRNERFTVCHECAGPSALT